MYSLRARSPEEQAARDFLAAGRAGAVILVADASCLERSLILALQVLERTPRAVLCLTLMDEARRRGCLFYTSTVTGRSLRLQCGRAAAPILQTAHAPPPVLPCGFLCGAFRLDHYGRESGYMLSLIHI